MRLLGSFWWRMVLWTAVISGILLGIAVLTVEGGGVLSNAPVWIGLAFVLAAYPAGIAVAEDVIPDQGLRVSAIGVFMAAAVSASLAAFVLANWLAPALLSSASTGGLPDPASMTLGEMRTELGVLGERARGGPATADNWLPFNHLAYHYVRRTDGMMLPALFACVGLFVGYWSRLIDRIEIRRMGQWGIAAFLLVSTYFAGENGYEMILTHIGGPAEFVGDLVLIVPGTLIIGLGFATVASLVSQAKVE